jgi:cell wall-associated NlpC family hydrolase
VRAIKPTARRIGRTLTGERARQFSVVAVISGLVGAFALPAYALNPTSDVTAAGDTSQHVTATSNAALTVDLDKFRLISGAQGGLIDYPSYHGPSVADFLKNPPYPKFSLDKVFEVAKKYQGVPYRFGGDSPSGFDCSGFVMFVYAQFGIALPHNAGAQGAMGKPIRLSDAKPGDVVIMAGHDGIYAGHGKILDAPQAGGVVSIRDLWTSDYYIVRLGI